MLKDSVKEKMIEAMKAKDRQKKDILGLISSEITRVEMAKKAKLVTEARKEEARKQNIDVDKVTLTDEKMSEINEKSQMTEDEEIKAIEKMVKSVKETISLLEGKADKVDALDKANIELEVYSQFLPKQMTEAEIRKVIEDCVEKLKMGNEAKLNKGILMKEVMSLVKGKADGSLVNKIAMEFLN